MVYITRCISGGFLMALTYRGALEDMGRLGKDASIHTLTGRWVGGRRIIQSRDFYVKEAAQFIEFLYAFGAARDVQWSEPITKPE